MRVRRRGRSALLCLVILLLVGGWKVAARTSPLHRAPAGAWRIAFLGDRDGAESVFLTRNGKPPVRVAAFSPPLIFMPVASPDGRRLILGEYAGETVLSLGDGQKWRLPSWAYRATWSPDSEWIAFSGSRPGIWLIRADGTDKRLLTRSFSSSALSWSPDGTAIAFVQASS